RRTPRSTLFPYTTLFRSSVGRENPRRNAGVCSINGVAEWPLHIAIALGDERLDVRVTLGPVPGPHHSLQGADVLIIGLLALGNRGKEVGSTLGGGRRCRLSSPGVGVLDRLSLPPPVAGVGRGLNRWLLGHGVLADTRLQKILHGLQAGRQLSHRVLERQQAGNVVGLVVLDALDSIEAGGQGGRLPLGGGLGRGGSEGARLRVGTLQGARRLQDAALADVQR